MDNKLNFHSGVSIFDLDVFYGKNNVLKNISIVF